MSSMNASSAITSITSVGGALLSGSNSNSANPYVTGTGVPGQLLELYDGARRIGAVSVDSTGFWSIKVAAALKAGTHRLVATCSDSDGNHGLASTPFSSVVPLNLTSATAAHPPILYGATDNFGPVKGEIIAGAFTDDLQPAIHGYGRVGDTIHVYEDKILIGSAVVGPDSMWSVKPATQLEPGAHVFRATATGGGQSASAMSNGIEFSIVMSAPPSIDNVEDGFGVVTGAIAANGLTDDIKPTLSGHGRPGDLLMIRDHGATIGSTLVNQSGTWTTPAVSLAGGAHDFTAVAPAVASQPPQESRHFALTVVDPLAHPVITSALDTTTGAVQSNMGHTSNWYFKIQGTGTPGDVLALYDNAGHRPDPGRPGAGAVASVVVDADGTWSYTTKSLASGENRWAAQSLTSGAASADFVLIREWPAAQAPQIANVYDNAGEVTGVVSPGGRTDDAAPVLNGIGHAGDIVTIRDNAKVLGSVTVDAGGHWRFKVTAPLGEGAHDFSATASGDMLSASATSNHYAITIAPTPVRTPPVITWVVDGTDHTNIAPNGNTHDPLPSITGTGQYGDVITVYESDKVIGSAVVRDAKGKWSITPSVSLDQGKHEFTAIASGNGQGPSAPSDVYLISILAPEPVSNAQTPVITGVHDDFGPVQGNVGAGRTTDDTTPTIEGIGHARDSINIYDGENFLGWTKADQYGFWSFTPKKPLGSGLHEFTAVAVDNATWDYSAMSGPYAIRIVPPLTAATPAITHVIDNAGSIAGNVATGGVTDETRPMLIGSGHAGDIVTVSDNGAPIGSTLVSANGIWTFAPTGALADGRHVFDVVASGTGQVASPASEHYVIVIDSKAPPAPTIDHVLDDVGAVQGSVPEGGTTDDATPTLHGAGRAGDVVTVRDSHGGTIGSAVVGSDGQWSVTPAKPLADGAHEFFAQATSSAGVASAASSTYAVNIAPDPLPAAERPLIVGVLDGVGAIQGYVPAGAATDDRSPMVNGYGHAGDVITVTDHGVPIGSTTVNNYGVWIFKAAPLDNGAHDFSAFAAGNGFSESPASNHYTFEVASPAAAALIGQNAARLSLADLLDWSEPALFATDAKAPVRDGKAAEHVDLPSTSFAGIGDVLGLHLGAVAHGGYEYAGAHAELLMQQNVGVALH